MEKKEGRDGICMQEDEAAGGREVKKPRRQGGGDLAELYVT